MNLTKLASELNKMDTVNLEGLQSLMTSATDSLALALRVYKQIDKCEKKRTL